ncbi:MAG TPA: hypothetical protein PKY86_09625 [Niabella sp.]|nr:hypothetical protein [Niabella sp.]HQW14892.1 hypothetical protein [Niabella sp.]HQX18483.1 hypothetical protein [Niabella sp.]HQX41481.1 hypothetical protein [Niabella sp.]HRB06010.1 hypothetical protein [Niabella sp.]
MSHLVITDNNELEEIKDTPKAHPALRVAATILSYIFHPVFIPVYVIAFLLYIEPFLFVGESARDKVLTLGRAFINYTFFPLVSILLLKGLNLIKSIKLQDRKDRIIPFIICNIWYFWIWYVWRGLPDAPRFLIVFAFSVFIASSIGLLANTYLKISMHGIALGTATTYLCLLAINPISSNITIYLAFALLITGLLGSARLLLKAHEPVEYYAGLGAGTLAVWIANLIV